MRLSRDQIIGALLILVIVIVFTIIRYFVYLHCDKCGDGGRETAKMLELKINPVQLLDAPR